MKKYFIKTLYLLIVALFSVACDFVGANTDPFNATKEMLSVDGLKSGAHFSQLQKNAIPLMTEAENNKDNDAVNRYQVQSNIAGDSWGGYFANHGNGWNSGQNFLTYTFNFGGWENYAFETSTAKISAPWVAFKANSIDDKESLALGTIVKIVGFHRATDMFGPIPYSKMGTGALSVEFDSQEFVYKSFLKELKESVDVLSEYTQSSLLANFDNVYKGNVVNWIKFGNSLMLRLAIRISYVEPTLAREYAELAVNHPLGVLTDARDLAAMNREANGVNLENPLAKLSEEYKECSMNASFESYLKGYQDPRLEKYFLKAKKKVGEDKYEEVDNFVGARIGVEPQAPHYELYSRPNIEKKTRFIWMHTSEVYFLRAEGALRGWNMGGSVEDLYKKGIEISFEENGIPASLAATYAENADLKPIDYKDEILNKYSLSALGKIAVKWDEAADSEEKLERIITQKWIAIYPNGQEAWSEYRRTGYPRLFPTARNLSGGTIGAKQVRRMPYSTKLYEVDRENLIKAAALLNGPDHGGTKLWWDAKN